MLKFKVPCGIWKDILFIKTEMHLQIISKRIFQLLPGLLFLMAVLSPMLAKTGDIEEAWGTLKTGSEIYRAAADVA